MKLSKRGEYTLRALIDLGIAREVGRTHLKVAELAGREKLPVKFLEQILHQLKNEGIIATKRGKEGGYFLAKTPEQISIGMVIRLIDGPLAPISCVSQTAYERCSCPDEDHCGLRMLMLDVRNAIAAILDRYHLSDVIDVTLRKLRRDGKPLPFEVPWPRAEKKKPAKINPISDWIASGGFLAELRQAEQTKSRRTKQTPSQRTQAAR
jgi:Rrf2 family protein